MNATFTNAPFTPTVRWLMEKQQKIEIGDRIRDLRENSPETNRSIADHVGVGERSVAAWIAGGGIAYDNAKKVADLFKVDIDWLWRGRDEQSPTPDPFAKGEADRLPYKAVDVERAIKMEAMLEALLDHFGIEWMTPEAATKPKRKPPKKGPKK